MLKKMWSRPACNQPAVRTVHHRPARNTGRQPLAPKRNRASLLGDKKFKKPPVLMPLGSATSISMYNVAQAPITNCVNPRSRPRRFKNGAKPHSPGFQRPHVRHCLSLTPTRVPHEGHTTEPHFCLSMKRLWRYIHTAVDGLSRYTPHEESLDNPGTVAQIPEFFSRISD